LLQANGYVGRLACKFWLEGILICGFRITYEELEAGNGVLVIVIAMLCSGDEVVAFLDELLALIERELELAADAFSLVKGTLVAFTLALVVIAEDSGELLAACTDALFDVAVLWAVTDVALAGAEEVTTDDKGVACDGTPPMVDEDLVVVVPFATDKGVFLTYV
jgi:hypothetical protein